MGDPTYHISKDQDLELWGYGSVSKFDDPPSLVSYIKVHVWFGFSGRRSLRHLWFSQIPMQMLYSQYIQISGEHVLDVVLIPSSTGKIGVNLEKAWRSHIFTVLLFWEIAKVIPPFSTFKPQKKRCFHWRFLVWVSWKYFPPETPSLMRWLFDDFPIKRSQVLNILGQDSI